MRKDEFLNELRSKLKGLPSKDIDDRISFYSEMIDDRIDEGKSEEEAVAEIGSVDDVVNDIAKDTPLVTLVKEKVKPNHTLQAWEIVLIILGFPLWFPLVLVGIILILVFYLLIWVFVIVSYAVELSFVAGSVGGVVLFLVNLFNGEPAMAYLGMAIMCIGAALLFIFACKGITKGTIKLSKKIMTGIKASFIKKGSKE